MKRYCTDSACLAHVNGPNPKPLVRRGVFYRKSDGQWIGRLSCSRCGKYYSSATFSPRYRQRKRHLNLKVLELLNSGVSQRRAARILRVNPKTVVRKFRYLAECARHEQKAFLESLTLKRLQYVQFDDLETSEHTKLKPLSVCLAVEPEKRKILGIQVSRMPPKGLLAKTAYQKYGPRRDERAAGWQTLFRELKPFVSDSARFLSDQNPHYPAHLMTHFPKAIHETVKGARGSVVGQGELKRLRFDPLFSLNHTCAMLRANLNRLFRRTWCTTKTIQGLEDHLALYVSYHNRVLTPRMAQCAI